MLYCTHINVNFFAIGFIDLNSEIKNLSSPYQIPFDAAILPYPNQVISKFSLLKVSSNHYILILENHLTQKINILQISASTILVSDLKRDIVYSVVHVVSLEDCSLISDLILNISKERDFLLVIYKSKGLQQDMLNYIYAPLHPQFFEFSSVQSVKLSSSMNIKEDTFQCQFNSFYNFSCLAVDYMGNIIEFIFTVKISFSTYYPDFKVNFEKHILYMRYLSYKPNNIFVSTNLVIAQVESNEDNLQNRGLLIYFRSSSLKINYI